MNCYFTLFYSLLDLRSSECNVISLYVCVALLMCLFVLCVACLTVFVNCLVKQFANLQRSSRLVIASNISAGTGSSPIINL